VELKIGFASLAFYSIAFLLHIITALIMGIAFERTHSADLCACPGVRAYIMVARWSIGPAVFGVVAAMLTWVLSRFRGGVVGMVSVFVGFLADGFGVKLLTEKFRRQQEMNTPIE